jgi:hypothetical protein
MKKSLVCLFLFLSSCHPACFQYSYQKQYKHLATKQELIKKEERELKKSKQESDYFLVLLVDAKHLDYSNIENLIQTVAKHPDGGRERDVGHAWVVLCGIKDGRRVFIEGGHSGELGQVQPRYLEGVLGMRHEANPVRYLYSTLHDGYFEEGPGHHTPTFAIRIDLDEERFLTLYENMQPERYPFTEYSLTQNQCTTFAVKMACLAGLELEHEVTVSVPHTITLAGYTITLWHDKHYATMTLSSPDVLEKSMMQAVAFNQAKPCLLWYHKEWPVTKEAIAKEFTQTLDAHLVQHHLP